MKNKYIVLVIIAVIIAIFSFTDTRNIFLNNLVNRGHSGYYVLDKFGIDVIVMVCNTIHLFYDKLQKEISTPILDLREELKESLKRKRIKSLFIIGTPNTIKQGLYRFKNIKSSEPNEKEIKQLTNAIFNFNKGIEKQKQVQIVRKICEKYICGGAETIILGCTEFAVMLGGENLPRINTIDILVEAIIQRYLECSGSELNPGTVFSL